MVNVDAEVKGVDVAGMRRTDQFRRTEDGLRPPAEFEFADQPVVTRDAIAAAAADPKVDVAQLVAMQRRRKMRISQHKRTLCQAAPVPVDSLVWVTKQTWCGATRPTFMVHINHTVWSTFLSMAASLKPEGNRKRCWKPMERSGKKGQDTEGALHADARLADVTVRTAAYYALLAVRCTASARETMAVVHPDALELGPDGSPKWGYAPSDTVDPGRGKAGDIMIGATVQPWKGVAMAQRPSTLDGTDLQSVINRTILYWQRMRDSQAAVARREPRRIVAKAAVLGRVPRLPTPPRETDDDDDRSAEARRKKVKDYLRNRAAATAKFVEAHGKATEDMPGLGGTQWPIFDPAALGAAVGRGGPPPVPEVCDPPTVKVEETAAAAEGTHPRPGFSGLSIPITPIVNTQTVHQAILNARARRVAFQNIVRRTERTRNMVTTGTAIAIANGGGDDDDDDDDDVDNSPIPPLPPTPRKKQRTALH